MLAVTGEVQPFFVFPFTDPRWKPRNDVMSIFGKKSSPNQNLLFIRKTHYLVIIIIKIPKLNKNILPTHV